MLKIHLRIILRKASSLVGILKHTIYFSSHKIIVVLVGLIFWGKVCGQDLPDSMVRKIDSICSKWDKPSSPGCAVGVVRNGSLVFSKGYGLADLEFGIPIT